MTRTLRERLPRRGDDTGSALVLTLAFLLLFGLFIATLLGQVGVHFRTTDVVRSRDVKTYNADAGIEYGLMRLRQDSTLCPNSDAGPQSLTADLAAGLLVNGSAAVDLTCETISGSSTGANGYAAMVRDTGSDVLTTSNGQEKLVEGPIYVGGSMDLGKPLHVTGGDVERLRTSGACPAQPANLTVDKPPYRWRCVGSAPALPPHELPSRPSTTNTTGNPYKTTGQCSVFRPGVYTSAPKTTKKNFFASGVYVLSNVGAWSINKQEVYGGEQAPGDGVQATSGAPCATDADAGVSNGSGVVFILEGDSHIDVGNQGIFELWARRPATGVTDGTPGMSLYAVPNTATPAGWNASTYSGLVVEVSGGSTAEMAVHGLIYAPTAKIQLFATNDSHAQALGGLVAYDLDLQSSASATGLAVSVKTGTGSRVVVITATAKGVKPGEAPVVATAVVQIANDASRTMSVLSRRVS